MKRAVGRSKADSETNAALVEAMWGQFCDLGEYESNVVDTTVLTVEDTVLAVKKKITIGEALLS